MADTIQRLKKQYGANSPDVAEQLNAIGIELQGRGDARTALKFHQEALTILEWNKCNAILYEFEKKSKEYAIAMAMTLRKIGNLLTEMNNFVGAAEVYKECLDTFLEGLVEGGGGLKRRLLECEYKKDSSSYQAVLDRMDRKTIGRILCLHPEFRAAVRDISQLFREMQCVKFVGQNAASSRRRRRMTQHSAMEENLKNAVESLSMSTTDVPPSARTSSERNDSGGDDDDDVIGESESPRKRELNRSLSWSSANTMATTDTEAAWMRCFYEKECGRFSRPRPLARRGVTSDEVHDHYKALSAQIVPGEQMLAVALNRFPLPASVTGDDHPLRQSSDLPHCFSLDSLHEVSSGDSEERAYSAPAQLPHMTAGTISPRCIAQPVFQEDMFKSKGRVEF